jgi:orotate phosphoribosyltransferase-like protein
VWRELADRARVLQATGAGLAEMARELEVPEGKVRWALGIATSEGLHRQKRPTVTRR